MAGGWNLYRLDFPFVSGLKLGLGCFTLGVFASTSLALDTEHELICLLAEDSDPEVPATEGFFSISSKFLVFISLSLAVMSIVILLLIHKDFVYVINALSQGHAFQFSWVVKEILFVFAVLLGECLTVARRYGRNLQLMFDLQLKAFRAVEKGDYKASVPVVSRDEFGLIAEGPNQMILGLRERIKRSLGKYMSPLVAPCGP